MKMKRQALLQLWTTNAQGLEQVVREPLRVLPERMLPLMPSTSEMGNLARDEGPPQSD